MNNEAKIMDMFYHSETKPRIRERLISREQYLELLEGQLEENRVLCVQGGGRRRLCGGNRRGYDKIEE